MQSLFFLIAATAGSSLVRGQYVCDMPTAGCTNGLFNQAICECECIEPFCHDQNGECYNPSSNCGGNKWADCTKGVNCPWWKNPNKAESCTTGPVVPPGQWKIYTTREVCCNTNFAYSKTCSVPSPGEAPVPPATPVTSRPTKHPTIAAPKGDEYEVIPIKFDVSGLPDDISMRELKEEMTTVLTRILLRLAERIPGLKVSSVEERVVLSRSLMNVPPRVLEKDVTLYYNVKVIRVDGKKFGPLIISEIRDSYGEVLDQIQTFADTKYFGTNLNMNWCTSRNGKFVLCAKDTDEQPSPTPGRAPTPAIVPSGGAAGVGSPMIVTGVGGGFPVWAIVIVVISLLLLLCCVGYFVFAGCRPDGRAGTKEVRNSNIYLDDVRRRNLGGDGARSVQEESRASRSGSRSHRPRQPRRPLRIEGGDEVQIVRAERRARFDDDSSSGDSSSDSSFTDDSFTVDTYGRRKKRTNGRRKKSTNDKRRTKSTRQKPGRDPTMYIPGQEDRPDPDSNILAIENGESGQRYYEDPPLRPKRDPTMYVEGNYASEDPPLKPKRDPTMYVEGRADPSVYTVGQEDPSVYSEARRDPTMYVDEASAAEYSVGRGRRDPTMYVDGASAADYSVGRGQRDPTMYVDGASAAEYSVGRGASLEGLSADPYEMGAIDDSETEYNQFGFRHTDEAAEEYARGARDPSNYAQEDSFQTQEVSVARSERSKQSRKGKKSSRSRRAT